MLVSSAAGQQSQLSFVVEPGPQGFCSVHLLLWPSGEGGTVESVAETLHAAYPRVGSAEGQACSWRVPATDLDAGLLRWLESQLYEDVPRQLQDPPVIGSGWLEPILYTIMITHGKVTRVGSHGYEGQPVTPPEHLRSHIEAVADREAGFPKVADYAYDYIYRSGVATHVPRRKRKTKRDEVFEKLLCARDHVFEELGAAKRSHQRASAHDSLEPGALISAGQTLLSCFARTGEECRLPALLGALPPGSHVLFQSPDEGPSNLQWCRTATLPFHLMGLRTECDGALQSVLGLRFAMAVSDEPSRRTSSLPMGEEDRPIRMLFLGDTENNPAILTELEQIKLAVGTCCQVVEPPMDAHAIFSWLSTADGAFDIVHYAGHNADGQLRVAPRRDGVGYQAGLLDAEEFSGILEELVDRGLAKLVFLNTCDTEPAYHTRGLPQLSEVACRAGAPSVVGTIGKLDFSSAGAEGGTDTKRLPHDKEAFAANFYRDLLVNGRTVGESMRWARESDYAAGRLTWAQYVLHGDPRLSVRPRSRVAT